MNHKISSIVVGAVLSALFTADAHANRACCSSDGTCKMVQSREACAGGEIQGRGVTCADNPCCEEALAACQQELAQALDDLACPRGCGCCSDFVVEAPGNFGGNTCGERGDCDLRNSVDHMYLVTIPEDGTWTFSTCGSGFDTFLFVGTTCCGAEIASNDDFCGFAAGSEVVADLSAGDYWVTVEGFSSSGCGDYVLDISGPE